MTMQTETSRNENNSPVGGSRIKGSRRAYKNADTSLMNYFRFIGNRKSLGAEEEMAAAENISLLEHALWTVILSDRELAGELSLSLGDRIRTKTKAEDEIIQEARTHIADYLDQTAKKHSRNRAAVGEGEPALTASNAIYALDEDRTLIAAAMDHIRRIKRPKKTKFDALRREVAALDRHVSEAKNAFIQENLGLVVNIAKRYHVDKMPLADLIQEGNLGLIRAVDKFDYTKGFRFSTYASWWIRSYISRAIVRKSNTVRIPEYMLRDRNRIKRTEEASRVKNGRAPNEEELASELGLSKKRLLRTRKHDVAFVESLDREMPGSDNQRYIDFLSDDQAKSPLENVTFNAWVRDIPDTLSKLSVTERFVICWRFGLLDGEEMTLQEIGKCLNLSRERIRQIQEEALVKLRTRLEVDAA